MRGPVASRDRTRELYRQRDHDNGRDAFEWPQTDTVDTENMARNAFTRADDIHNNVLEYDDPAPMDAFNFDVEEDSNEVNFENLVRESTANVYKSSIRDRLQCSIVFFTL